MKSINVSTAGHRLLRRWFQRMAVCGLLIHLPGSAWGQLATPLHVGAGEPILNEFGEVIEGHAFMPVEERPLVQILRVGTGILPPDPSTGQPMNEVLDGGDTSIGNLTDPALSRSGLFSTTFNQKRPSDGEQVFVRVYNAPTIEASLFYADSTNTMTVSGSRVLLAYMGSMTNLVHPYRDTDGDGIRDWWEHLHAQGNPTGINANARIPGKDTTWLEDYVAGTDPFDTESYFMIISVRPHYGDTFTEYLWEDDDPLSDQFGTIYTQRMYDVVGEVLTWPSVAGREYDLMVSTNLMSGAFEPLADAGGLPATPPLNVFTNWNLPDEDEPGSRFYRAVVRWPEAEQP